VAALVAVLRVVALVALLLVVALVAVLLAVVVESCNDLVVDGSTLAREQILLLTSELELRRRLLSEASVRTTLLVVAAWFLLTLAAFEEPILTWLSPIQARVTCVPTGIIAGAGEVVCGLQGGTIVHTVDAV